MSVCPWNAGENVNLRKTAGTEELLQNYPESPSSQIKIFHFCQLPWGVISTSHYSFSDGGKELRLQLSGVLGGVAGLAQRDKCFKI